MKSKLINLTAILICLLLTSCLSKNDPQILSFEKVSITEFDPISFVDKIAKEINEQPQNLYLSNSTIKTSFNDKSEINNMFLEFYSKNNLNNYQLNVIRNSSNSTNITLLKTSKTKNNNDVLLLSFLKSLKNADWNNIILGMEKSDLYGFMLNNEDNFFKVEKYINNSEVAQKYYVSKNGITKKINPNEEVNTSGSIMEMNIHNYTIENTNEYSGGSSETSVVLEIE